MKNQVLNQKIGLSLIELMVTLSVISILVGFAIPRYNIIKINAASVEAIQNVTHISNLQISYLSENGHYAWTHLYGMINNSPAGFVETDEHNNIGFSVTDIQKLRFVYGTYPDYDHYNHREDNTINIGGFSSLAYTSGHSDGGWGRGLGISYRSCDGFFYEHTIVMNQNRQIGIYGEGSGTDFTDRDARKKCL